MTDVSIGCLFGGGVVINDKSLAAIKLNCRVLGIGVADKVRTSTFFLIDFNISTSNLDLFFKLPPQLSFLKFIFLPKN